MSSEERLRIVAKALIDKVDPDMWEFPWRWFSEVKAIKDTFEASESTDLERLMDWLLIAGDEAREEMAPHKDPYDRGYLNAFALVRNYITKEFGVKKVKKMKAEKVIELLLEYGLAMEEPEVLDAAQCFADEIAKLCKEDKWDTVNDMYLAWRSNEDKWIAKLAVMTEALETIQGLSGTDVMIHSSMQAAKMVAKQALSATPKEKVKQEWEEDEVYIRTCT